MLTLSLHVAFLAVWSAALVYFPLLFVEHRRTEDRLRADRIVLLQRWIYAKVMTTSALATVAAGTWLVFERGFGGGWLHVKLALVLGMALFHGFCGHLMVDFKRRGYRYPGLFYRALPAIPAALILGVLRPSSRPRRPPGRSPPRGRRPRAGPRRARRAAATTSWCPRCRAAPRPGGNGSSWR
jgi:putative membrane protein